jgi:hypothetical protein
LLDGFAQTLEVHFVAITVLEIIAQQFLTSLYIPPGSHFLKTDQTFPLFRENNILCHQGKREAHFFW